MAETLLQLIQFPLPATALEAAFLSRRSIDLALDIAGESMTAVHGAMQRFGRTQIAAELGERGPALLKVYDTLMDLLGNDLCGAGDQSDQT